MTNPVAPFKPAGTGFRGGHVSKPFAAAPRSFGSPRASFGTPQGSFGSPVNRVTVVRPGRSAFAGRPFIAAPAFGFDPFIWNSPFYGAPFYAPYLSPAYVEPPYVSAAPGPGDYLADEVQQLQREVDELRQQQVMAQAQQPASVQIPSPPPDLPATPTILVFRDGRRMAIHNYAVVGQTLWILDEKVARKISLSELDLQSTQNENRNQGVRFVVSAR